MGLISGSCGVTDVAFCLCRHSNTKDVIAKMITVGPMTAPAIHEWSGLGTGAVIGREVGVDARVYRQLAGWP